MKYLSQFCIIMGFTLAGEALQRLIPLPIPAAVYGIALLFGALSLKLVRLEQVKQTGHFLKSLLPLRFDSPTVGIVEHWPFIRQDILPIGLLILSTTVVTFGISGQITQRIHHRKEDSK